MDPKSSSSKATEPQNVYTKGSFKTIEDGSKKDTPFKTIVNRVTNLNPRYMVPVDEVTQVISDPKAKETDASSHRTAVQWSTSSRIMIQPHLCGAQDQWPSTVPGIFRHCSPTALTASETWRVSTTSRPTLLCHQSSMEDEKVPIKYKEEIKKELAEMVWQRIITKQTEPTPWVSSLTYPKKANGKLRICLDPKDLNKAIIHENHKAPTLKKIAHMSSREPPSSQR